MITISEYTGKCDCYDVLIMIHDVTDFSNVRIYAYGNDLIPLRIDSRFDLMPYYPYLTASMSASKDDGIIVHLSRQSYVDSEEEDWLKWRLEQLKKYYRHCKRNHKEFNEEEAAEKISVWKDHLADYEKKLISRVKTDGEKATYDNIHIARFENLRKMLCDDMIEAGYDPLRAKLWCFGWRKELLEEIK